MKATNKPEVILFLRYSDYFINLCVHNIGAGYASDVEFGEDLSFKTVGQYEQEDKVLKDIEPFKRGINFLGNGHKIDTVLCDSRNVRDLEKRSFNILVSYKDSAGKTFKQLFPFDLGNWENTSQYLSPHTDEIANAVGRVAGQLEQANRQRSSESSLQRGSTGMNQLLNIKDPQIAVLERIADALEKLPSGK